jgi:hypothetical protein
LIQCCRRLEAQSHWFSWKQIEVVFRDFNIEISEREVNVASEFLRLLSDCGFFAGLIESGLDLGSNGQFKIVSHLEEDEVPRHFLSRHFQVKH